MADGSTYSEGGLFNLDSVKVVIHCTARGSFPWLLPQQFQGDKPGAWYIAILHGVNSRRQFCCSMHRDRVLVSRAAVRKYLRRVTALLILKKYYKKRGTRRRSILNSVFCEVKVALQQFVRNWLLSCTQRIIKITSGCLSNYTLQILLSTKHGMLEELY